MPADKEPMRVSRDGHVLVLSFREKELAEAAVIETIEKQVAGLWSGPIETRWVIDFSDVELVVSQMLNLVLRTLKKVRQAGGDVVICGLNRNLERMFQITRLDQILKVYPTQAEAVAALSEV